MPSLNPYLNFNGNTEEAFKFYQSVFGGELSIQRFKDTPESGNIPEADRNKVMHVMLPIGKGNSLMGTDAMESVGQKVTVGNNFYISIDTESQEEADRLFKGLSAGGKVELEMQKTFWGSYFGMFADKFGIQWMISYSEQRQG
jgi:PhnB protein